MSLIWFFEQVTKSSCMALHHATVIAERWGRLSLSLEQLHSPSLLLSFTSAPVTTLSQGRWPSNSKWLDKDLPRLPNTCLGLMTQVYETQSALTLAAQMEGHFEHELERSGPPTVSSYPNSQ